MRTMFALVFFLLASWRVYLDWKATAALGEQMSLVSTQSVWQGISPSSLAWAIERSRSVELFPELWDPGMVTFLSLPMAPVLLITAIFFFAIRRKPEPIPKHETIRQR